MSENVGKRFEHDFRDSCKNRGLYVYRLPDAYVTMRKVDPDAYVSTNPADYLLHHDGILYWLELKSTDKKSISIAHKDEEGKTISGSIRLHQPADLLKLVGECEKSFFILQFQRDTDKQSTWALEIKDFFKFYEESGKQSINELDVVQYHGIYIPGKKIRTHYDYDVQKIVQ